MRVMCAFVLVVGLAMPAQAQGGERSGFFSGQPQRQPRLGVRAISEQDTRKGAETAEKQAKANIKAKPLSCEELFRNVPFRAKEGQVTQMFRKVTGFNNVTVRKNKVTCPSFLTFFGSVAGRVQLSRWEDCYALDDLCHSLHHVVIRDGDFLHDGWLHSHPARTRTRSRCNSVDYRAPGAVTYIDSIKLSAVNMMRRGMSWGGYPDSSVARMIRFSATKAC